MGVLGVGDMGKRHAENLRRLMPQAHLVAVADVDAARAKKTADQLEIDHSYSSLDAMLENKAIDAVLIAAPDKFHAGAVEAAARAGKDKLPTRIVPFEPTTSVRTGSLELLFRKKPQISPLRFAPVEMTNSFEARIGNAPSRFVISTGGLMGLTAHPSG